MSGFSNYVIFSSTHGLIYIGKKKKFGRASYLVECSVLDLFDGDNILMERNIDVRVPN